MNLYISSELTKEIMSKHTREYSLIKCGEY